MPEKSLAARRRTLCRLLPVLVLLVTAGARAEAPRIFAITDARIVTAPGKVIEHGTIVLRDGLIEAVGANVQAPADAEVIKAEPGWSVYPAFIDAASSVGLDAEGAATGAIRPGGGRGGPPPKELGARHELKAVHPEDRVVDRLDLGSSGMGTHREMGFAMAQVLPDKGVFRGESAIITLRKAPAPELVVQARAAQVIALEAASFMASQYPSSTFGAVATVRQVFLDEQRQAEWRTRYAADPAGMTAPPYHSSDAPLLDVLQGKRPITFVTLNGLDPGRFRNLAAEFHLPQADVVARNLGDRVDDLVAAGMPVLLPLELPEKPDLATDDDLAETSMRDMQRWLMAPKLPAALDAAGVKLAFVTLGMKSPRNFQDNLAAIVKAGYPAEKALAAVTTTPAELLGISRSAGTLEPGKQANLLVVDGDLFVGKPKLRHVFVDGYDHKIEAEKAVGDPNAVIDPRGTWAVTTEVMGRASPSTWTITGTKDPDGKGNYQGSSEGERGKRDFSRVEVTGNAMTVVSPGEGGELAITVVVTGDSFAGESTMESPRGSVTMKFSGRRTASPEGMQL